MSLDETTQEWLDSKFDSSGEPVESGDVDYSAFTDDDLIVDQGFRSEGELADAFSAARDEEAVQGWADQVIGEHELANLALQEQAAEDALLEGGYGQQEQPADPRLIGALEEFERTDPSGYRALASMLGTELPLPLTAEQQLRQTLAESTTASLAALADVERSRSEREAWNEAQAQQQEQAVLVEAYGRAEQIAQPLLQKHDAAHADMEAVLSDADEILTANGWGQEQIAALDEWTAQALAKEAIALAAERAGHAAITERALAPYRKGR